MSYQQFGLLVAGKLTQVPLKDVSVTARASGYLLGLDSTLKYSNESADPLEVVFRFPIEESFAVVGLEAVIAGRRIKAEIREKEEARQMYDDALASGFTAALAEEKSGDIFSISLGNLPPKSDAELHLKLAGELPIDAEGGVRFTLPSVLKPRYTPIGSTDPLAKVGGGADASQVQQASSPAVFNFEFKVAGADTVSKVTSPTHTINTKTKDGSIQVSLAEGVPLDKDLVILVYYNEPHEPKAIPEPASGKSEGGAFMGSPAVMLDFFPKFTSSRAACEFVFVVDRSGSMGGAYINSARETLILFLKSIPPGCRINIIGFGSSYQSLFPNSVAYNQQNLDIAIHHAEGMQADLGGTELLSPLRYVFKQPLLPGLPRQVFVLTDGSVSNTHACIQEVKSNVKHARVFTFGIGSGASTALVKGLARAGSGVAEFVQAGERMQPKVISSLKRALQPSVTDLKVEFQVPKQYEVLQAPGKLPMLFNGDKVVVYGIFKPKVNSKTKGIELGGVATLKGRILDQTVEYSIPFQIPKPSEGVEEGSFGMPIVHHLAAKSLIQDWQNGEGLQLFSDKQKKIIDLSIEASVVSAHTAYIAVDEEQEKPIEGAIKTWDVTAAMAQQEMSQGYLSFGVLAGGLGAPRQSYAPYRSGMSSASAFSLCAPASAAPAGSLFGGPSPQSVSFGLGGPPAPTGGGLFGGPPPQSTSFSFGGSAPPPAPPGGGLFGGPPPQSTNFSFGGSAPPPAPPGGGLFGGPPPPPPTRSSSGLFGGPPPPPPPAPSSHGFGFGGPPITAADGVSVTAMPKGFRSTSSSFGVTQQLQQSHSSSSRRFGRRFHGVDRDGFGQDVFGQDGSTDGGPTLGGAARRVAAFSPRHTRLILLQAAEGFWRLDSTLASVFSKSPNELESACPMKLEGESLRTVWATVLTLVYLETQCQGDRDEWELVAMKAEMWLQGQTLPDGATVGTLREAAEKYWK